MKVADSAARCQACGGRYQQSQLQDFWRKRLVERYLRCKMRLATLVALVAATARALQPPRLARQRPTRLYNTAEVEACLNDEFPSFAALVFQNEELWRGLRDGSGYTVLAPNEAAFAKLDDKRQKQLKDPRNGEVVEQIGAYHVISDPVSKDDLYESSGVVTAGGRIDVGRSVVGGFMGIGGREDGGVTVNGAKIVSSKSIGECIIHEMDDFAHPKVLDRYFDQLRIPGSS